MRIQTFMPESKAFRLWLTVVVGENCCLVIIPLKMLSLKKRASKLEYDLLNHNYDLEDYYSKKGYYDASFNDDSEDNSLNSDGKCLKLGEFILDFKNLKIRRRKRNTTIANQRVSLHSEDSTLTSFSENEVNFDKLASSVESAKREEEREENYKREPQESVDSANSDSDGEEREKSYKRALRLLQESIGNISIAANENENHKRKLFLFYEKLLIDMMVKFSVTFSDVSISAQRIISWYSRVFYGPLPDIDYTKKDNCLAYLHRYAICHAALVAEAVTDIFESSSSTILTSKLDKRKVNVMFLGGGPGNDFVGFLTALNGRCERLFDLDVTIVDKMSGWEDIFTETVKELRKGEGSYEKVGSIFDEVNIFPTFIKADLSEYDAWTAEMENKLKTADIVFLVKALSHVPDSHKRLILMNIVGCSKNGALLVYMDHPYPCFVFSLLISHFRDLYTASKDKYHMNFLYSGYFECTSITPCTATVKVLERCRRSF
ncbi:uncharacterized protein CDAR_517901 [Caerostris darwini]|uniref:Uncharacterized protein n=1 Tax=Caerostris darwini TaxID=1538125 RepID=A0AAV4PUG5_9ARAC|nr:uncharacterized protein CDAR_517901 [Caerostris darwini]